MMKDGFTGRALILLTASSSVPRALGLAGLSNPTWLSLICRKVSPLGSAATASPIMPIERGMPRSMGIIGEAVAAEPSGLTFLQISDSHVGFDKPANPNALGTLEEAVNKIKALPVKPSFIIHTGDITHLSKPSEFDDADRIISQARFDVHYVPGEHDVLDEEVNLYRDRYGRGTKGAGWYSF